MPPPPTDLQRIAAFRLAFARRQAAKVTELPGGNGIAVLDPQYAASHEHNQLFLTGTDPGTGTPPPHDLPALADAALSPVARHRRITILDDATGTAYAPALTAAGYVHEPELVMAYTGTPKATTPNTPSPAQPVTLTDLRPALVRQLRRWMPQAEDTVVAQLADRRATRLHGTDEVRFLAVRDEHGTIGSWADLYRDPDKGIAQLEDVVTADTHTRRGYADALLATALHHAAADDLFFLIADPDDWPRTWYTRRGFTTLGHAHAFTRTGI